LVASNSIITIFAVKAFAFVAKKQNAIRTTFFSSSQKFFSTFSNTQWLEMNISSARSRDARKQYLKLIN
jgi:hypothetical protein